MTELKYAVLGYSNFYQGKYHEGNYGDEIQSIAATRCLPRVDAIIDRNELCRFSNPVKHILLMNGFFGSGRLGAGAFPPSGDIVPIYFSFHISTNEFSKAFFTSPKILEHFKIWEPIGCRDKETARLLGNKGINTYLSKCLTLTFDKRLEDPIKGKLYIVDGNCMSIPKSLTDGNTIRKVTHEWSGPFPGYQENMKVAQRLLDHYREEADSVITSRLHCALPCLAMGISTIFMPKTHYGDYGRVRAYAEAGGKMPLIEDFSTISSSTVFRLFPRFLKQYVQKGERALSILMLELYKENFDWQFNSIEYECEKKSIRHSLRIQIEKQLSKL